MQPKIERIIARGQALESQGNLNAAETEFKKGLRIHPRHLGQLDLLGPIALKKCEFHKNVQYN
jgi:hypothetical protein